MLDETLANNQISHGEKLVLVVRYEGPTSPVNIIKVDMEE
jgi:hypothetical protein